MKIVKICLCIVGAFVSGTGYAQNRAQVSTGHGAFGVGSTGNPGATDVETGRAAAVSQTTTSNFSGPQTHASATAIADEANGLLRGSIDTESLDPFTTGATVVSSRYSSASLQASFRDIITFTKDPSSNITDLYFSMNYEGSEIESAISTYPEVDLAARFYRPDFGQLLYKADVGTDFNGRPVISYNSGWLNPVGAAGLNGGLFSGIIRFSSSSFSFGFDETLIVVGSDGAKADLLHTARINFLVPNGVNFTSGSGLFNAVTYVSSGVPEPATWGMTILGFGTMGFAMRHRSKLRTNVSFA